MMMIGLTLLVVGATAYVWCTRGFFSALIHLVCVLVAGAVAFGVWEPLAYLLLDNAPEKGFLSFLSGTAFGLGLALPFAVTLAILRAIVDKVLPSNAQLTTTGDYIGGGICGLLSGVVSAGIMVISIGFLRLPADFWGYNPVTFSNEAGGSVVRAPGAMRPWVDRITAGLYGHLSLTTMRTGTPLAVYHPDLETEPGALRFTYESRSRNTVQSKGFTFNGWYVVGDPAKPQPIGALLRDSWKQTTQKVVDVTGEPVERGYVAGFLLTWNAKAREKAGQVVVGNGQVRLVVQSNDDDDDARPLHPVAMVGRTNSPTQVEYARFRFETDSTFISSVGGESEASMAFEFAVPEGYHPLALYVKGVRVDLMDEEGTLTKPLASWPDTAERDAAIKSGQIRGMGGVGPILDPNTGKPIEAPQGTSQEAEPVQVTTNIGFTIQKGTEGDLEVAQEGRNGSWAIRSGKKSFDVNRPAPPGLEGKLRIDRFSVDDSTMVVKVDITPKRRPDDFNTRLESADKRQAPVLVDTNGTRYPAVGYVYKDSRVSEVAFNKGTPIGGLGEEGMRQVSTTNPNRSLVLVFVVTSGVDLKSFNIGDTEIETYPKPIHVENTGRH